MLLYSYASQFEIFNCVDKFNLYSSVEPCNENVQQAYLALCSKEILQWADVIYVFE
ncbi:hypothetical protein PPHE_a1312 [Pseudoalteromonas phenolica O-BC30]|nr:hypothetical protein [Pseudoalteromonas phenolica O-BC30]